MKALLIHSGAGAEFRGSRLELWPPEPPLGLLSIATVLRDRGNSVKVIDDNAKSLTEETLLAEIRSPDLTLVGLSATSVADTRLRELSTHVRRHRPDVVLVAGGPHGTLSYRELLEDCVVDYCVVQEGETAMARLAEVLDGQAQLGDVPNLAYKSKGQVMVTEVQREDLATLPLPDRRFLDPGPYADRFARLSTSRGCPYSCSFCATPLKRFKYRPADAVVEEIAYLKRDYGARRVRFREDNFLVHEGRVAELCERLIASRLDVKWACECRVDNLSEGIIRLMARAQCEKVSLGVEVLTDPDIRETKCGRYSYDRIKRILELLQRHGIAAVVNLMVGLPFMTRAGALRNIWRSIFLPAHSLRIYECLGIPGSPLYEVAEQRGLVRRRCGRVLLLKSEHLSGIERKAWWWSMKAVARLKSKPWTPGW